MKSIEELSDEIVRRMRDATSKRRTNDSSEVDQRQIAEPDTPIEETERSIGDPDCPICHGMGYVRLDVPVDHPHFGKLFPCTCRMDELQARRSDTLRALSNLDALGRFTFETFSVDGGRLSPERQRTLRHAYEVARAYARDPQGWLLLIGGYGSGKTHLAAAIANETLERGIMPLFVTVPDLLDHLRAAFAPNAAQPYSDRFEQVRNARLLILDDLGTENATPWALEKLFQLLNHRYMSRLATVITTNQELEHMEPRLRSRLADPDLVEIVTILAPDYRLGGVDRLAPNLNTLTYYSDMTFGTFNLRREELPADQVSVLAEALKLAQTYAADPEGWIVFAGQVGAGKTHLAAAIANERVRLGHPALLVVVPDLLD
ncbi:MAG: ATP-binding protein, partial [Anaerolineae bacterium]